MIVFLLTALIVTRVVASMRKRTKALRRTETGLTEAQRLSHTGSFVRSVPSGEIFWSDEMFRIFQNDRMTKPTVELILQRVHPEDATFVKQTIDRVSQEGKDYDFEYRLLMPDGSIKYVHVVGHAERDQAGELELVGAVMDVTAAKEAEAKLRRSEAYLLEAQRLSHMGTWVHDVTSGITFASPELLRIFGHDPDQYKPTRGMLLEVRDPNIFRERVHPEDVASFDAERLNKTKAEPTRQLDYRIVLPDG